MKFNLQVRHSTKPGTKKPEKFKNEAHNFCSE